MDGMLPPGVPGGRQLDRDALQMLSPCNLLPVDQNVQPLSPSIACSVPIPENAHAPPMVQHIIQREVLPLLGRQGLYFKDVVRAWLQADQAGDDQIIETGMKIVLAVVV